ncbi:MAG: proline--tRNA ligase [Candidatus Aenigmarchaeota archaeon]|nr:proline--tRNA ligase [Candidatus Aenigmarchaeota archaeon]
MGEELGITVSKEKIFSDWYLEVVRKGQFVDQRTPLKGFDVFMPWGYATWERFVSIADTMFKEKLGVQNAYFPMLIPLSFFVREKEHLEGFNPDLLQITEAHGEQLGDPLILRPTSETIIYSMFAQWIRSWRDLPMKVNQWVNMVRWETKMTKPLVRPREFLWHEGHTAHADREDALKMVEAVEKVYTVLHEDVMALPCMKLLRTPLDTFPGAEFSIAFDVCMPDGKIIQGATDHLLNDAFPRAFDIKYEDKNNETRYVRTTSWGLSERELGMVLMMHGDDKGAILPPNIAPVQVVIIPILFKGSEKVVVKEAAKTKKKLEKLGIRTTVDDRDGYSAGFKFNEWELKGVPLRVEIGPRDVKEKQCVLVRRDTGEKIIITDVKKIRATLDEIQQALFHKAKTFAHTMITDATTLADMQNILEAKGGFVRINWCESKNCEESVKEKTGGAEIRGSLYEKREDVFSHCIMCGKQATKVVYVAKAY